MVRGDAFSLGVSRAFGKVVVHIHGPLDAGSAPALKQQLADVIDVGCNRQVILDLREMSDVDFAGVLVIVDAVLRVQEQGGELLLSGPRPGVAETLRAVGVAEVVLITPEWTHPARGVPGADRGP